MRNSNDSQGGLRCPDCNSGLVGRVTRCPWCSTRVHTDCWVSSGGCSISGCRGSYVASIPGAPTPVTASLERSLGGSSRPGGSSRRGDDRQPLLTRLAQARGEMAERTDSRTTRGKAKAESAAFAWLTLASLGAVLVAIVLLL